MVTVLSLLLWIFLFSDKLFLLLGWCWHAAISCILGIWGLVNLQSLLERKITLIWHPNLLGPIQHIDFSPYPSRRCSVSLPWSYLSIPSARKNRNFLNFPLGACLHLLLLQIAKIQFYQELCCAEHALIQRSEHSAPGGRAISLLRWQSRCILLLKSANSKLSLLITKGFYEHFSLKHSEQNSYLSHFKSNNCISEEARFLLKSEPIATLELGGRKQKFSFC